MKEKSDLGDERATRADRRRWARILIGVQILMALGLVIMLVASRVIGSIEEFDPFAIFFVAILGIYSVVGYLVAARQPENPIGLLLCAVGPLWLVSELGDAYAQLRLDGKPLPGAVWASWAGNWVWVPAMGLIGIFLLLLFPNGRLLSRRWRPVFWAGVLGTLLAAVSVAFEPDPLEGGFTNPLVASGTLADVISNMGFPIFLLSLLAAATSLIFRLRASSGEERQQMKWLIYPAALVGPLLILAAVAEGFLGGCSDNCGTWEVIGAIGWIGMLGMVLLGFPIAMGIAILKYRLYDIDVVINKTLVFGALAAFITAVYVAVVVGIGTLLGSSNEPNLGLSIAATAIVAIAFQPVKDRVERVANRLVYGIRRTPYEVLADFSDKVATSYETQEVTPAMARTLKEATGAARAEVWLALDSTLVLSASSGAGGETNEGRGGDDVIVLDGGGIDAIAGADEVAAVTHQQELLGALAIAKERGEPVTSADRRLLSDLAAQAGIVLRNARLTAELQARLDEISMRAEQIRESRRRIVAAQDRARRRLERDIHDGAQQHLVALAVKLNLAKTMTERKPERAAAMLDQLETEMGDALETLNDLARGIYPPLLKDKGIAAALEARAASAPFELTVVDRSSARADEATEAAIYFCCLEALQNVAKYAGASTVVVEIDDLDGLGFSVTDDGSGFDPGAVIDGSGLQGMADRLAAVGGTVEIDSSPGRGTTVAGKVGGAGDESGMNDRSAQGAGSTGTIEGVREPWGGQAALVWGVLLLSAGLLIGYMVLFFQLEETRRSFADLGFGVVVVIFVIAGSFITLKEPRNLVGWMLTLFGFAALLSSFLNAYGLHAIAQRPRLPLAGLAATFDSAVGDWVPPLFLTFALMLFPNGKLPSPRWRWLAFVALIVYAGAFFAQLFRPGLTLRIPIENPLGIAGARESIDALRDLAGTVLGPLFVATAATLFVRRRRASGIEKHQLRWLFYVASLLAFDLVLGIVVEGLGVTTYDWIGILLFGASLVGIPIAIAVAILKYRLYDIDVVINKTLVFGALAAFITAVYVAVVVGIGALLGSSEEPNLVLSIAATALVAIAFQPVKERVQRVANRLVYGQRSTPYEVMANLSRVASGAIEPHDILPSVAAVAASGVGARAARVSLVLHSGDTLEATHPPELEDDLHYDVVVPLRHRDETIGELAVAKAAGEQLSPGDRKLLEDLAAQAALALHNARLAIELGARLDEISIQAHELDASRRRIVSAQNDSRRRLERDISSGPRLNLEDMRGELAAIKEVMDDDPQRAAGLLGELAGRAHQTLDALRDLARGIFPPLLADKGIVAALEAHIRKHELDVELQADEGLRAARFDERVEIAVYFCCLEALASRSAQTVLALEVKDGELEMSCSGVVLDDARRETIRDRVEALAGTVRLGEGGRLRARFPVAVLEVAG